MTCIYCKTQIVKGQEWKKLFGISPIHTECYGVAVEILMDLLSQVQKGRDRRKR